MPSKAEVSLYYLDQDHTWEKPFKTIPREDARGLKLRNLGRFFDNGRAFRLHKERPLESRPNWDQRNYPSSGIQSDTTISYAEMCANAGESGNPLTVRFARYKVKRYPRTFDRAATLANPFHFVRVEKAVLAQM